MKNTLFIITLFIGSFSYAQVPPPLPQIEITSDKKKLIDELIRVTNFENYVYNYCKSIISQYARQNNWDDKKTQKILENSNYKYFNQVLYYTFKNDSDENIESLIKSFSQINQKRNSEEFLTPNNIEIQKELMQFTVKIIQGQFLINNK